MLTIATSHGKVYTFLTLDSIDWNGDENELTVFSNGRKVVFHAPLSGEKFPEYIADCFAGKDGTIPVSVEPKGQKRPAWKSKMTSKEKDKFDEELEIYEESIIEIFTGLPIEIARHFNDDAKK